MYCSPKYYLRQCWVPDQPDSKCGNGFRCFNGRRYDCFGGIHIECNEEDHKMEIINLIMVEE